MRYDFRRVWKKTATVKEQVYLNFSAGELNMDYPFVVIPGLSKKIILGCDWLNDKKASINFAENIYRGSSIIRSDK